MIFSVISPNLQFGSMSRGGAPENRVYGSERKAEKKAKDLNQSAPLENPNLEWGVEPTTDNRGKEAYQVRKFPKKNA